jgi:hypothetical protein
MNRLGRGSTSPRHKKILLKRFLTENFNSKSSQLLKDIRDLIRKKENEIFSNFKFEFIREIVFNFKFDFRFQFSIIRIL